MAARHLKHYHYEPTVYYPKQTKNELYQVNLSPFNMCQSGRSLCQRLVTQLKNLDIPFTEDFASAINDTDHVVDAIFGNPHLPL